jgi:hypothetical protein
MSETVELKKTIPVVASEEKVPEKGLTEDSFVHSPIITRFEGVMADVQDHKVHFGWSGSW